MEAFEEACGINGMTVRFRRCVAHNGVHFWRTKHRFRHTGPFRDPCRDGAYCNVLGLRRNDMLYSILCYESESLAAGRTKQEDDAMMGRLQNVLVKIKNEGRLGPVARLMPTTTATHIRSGKDPVVIDGPFAETKEQLLGFYVIDCPSLEEAIAAAKLLAQEKPHGTLEIRPVALFNPVGTSL